MYTVAVIVGSLRKASMNKKLARALEKIGNEKLQFVTLPIGDLPLYNQDFEANLPTEVVTFKEAVAAMDAVLFVTPEYNRSIPGVLKNAIDWASRPYGKGVWAGKPAAIAGTSAAQAGTAVAQAHLRSVLTMVGMALTAQYEVYIVDRPGVIEEDGTVTNESTKNFLKQFLVTFADWIEQVKK